MISYRKSLEQIGISRSERVAYSDFYSKPKSLLKAMEAMQPAGAFDLVSDNPNTASWTEELQGCASDGAHWFFTSNQQSAKNLYAFAIGDDGSIGPSCGTFMFADDVYVTPRPGEDVGEEMRLVGMSDVPVEVIAKIGGIEHIGQLEAFEDKLYVSHFNGAASHVFVLNNDNGQISYHDWLPVAKPISPLSGREAKVQFQCIMPWDRTFLTCFGDGDIREMFVHNLKDGTWTGRTVLLQETIPAHWWVQGAAVSDYGHLFISISPEHGTNDTADNVFPVPIFSPLNGKKLGAIPVRVEEWRQELEGCCYRPIPIRDGRSLCFHVVLSDRKLWQDRLIFKSFHRSPPAV